MRTAPARLRTRKNDEVIVRENLDYPAIEGEPASTVRGAWKRKEPVVACMAPRTLGAGEARTVGDWGELGAVLDDDFNTPAALAIFHRWAREGALAELRRGLGVFGLAELADGVEAPGDIVALARSRAEARAARDFAESDRLRDEIAASGWEVRDVQGSADGFELVPLS